MNDSWLYEYSWILLFVKDYAIFVNQFQENSDNFYREIYIYSVCIYEIA